MSPTKVRYAVVGLGNIAQQLIGSDDDLRLESAVLAGATSGSGITYRSAVREISRDGRRALTRATPTAHPKEDAMAYIDGFVIAVPQASKDSFVQHAKKVDALFLEHGATRVLECWGDDVPEGKQTDFRRAVQAKDDEAVVFSWVEWPDKVTRDAGMKRAMEDPRMKPENNPMPFDGKRMIFGGFSPVITLGK